MHICEYIFIYVCIPINIPYICFILTYPKKYFTHLLPLISKMTVKCTVAFTLYQTLVCMTKKYHVTMFGVCCIPWASRDIGNSLGWKCFYYCGELTGLCCICHKESSSCNLIIIRQMILCVSVKYSKLRFLIRTNNV